VSTEIIRELAPTGTLRAAVNFGNPVLAQKDTATGAPRGISVDLARELGRRLGTPVEFIGFESAGATVEAAKHDGWDIGFLAIDPLRAQDIIFSPPYVVIEGSYLVRANSPLKRVEEVEAPGIRVVVGKGSAYDLFLKRTLKQASLIEAPTSAAALDVFLNQGFDVAAGVRRAVENFARDHAGLRILPGRFMEIRQAVATPTGRPRAASYLRDFIEELKQTGFVAKALNASGQSDAVVAPADGPK
jgi:polar amino acid transport system substrate-binding protein